MGEMAVLVNTELRVGGVDNEGRKITGNIVLLPDPDALELLLRKLRVL